VQSRTESHSIRWAEVEQGITARSLADEHGGLVLGDRVRGEVHVATLLRRPVQVDSAARSSSDTYCYFPPSLASYVSPADRCLILKAEYPSVSSQKHRSVRIFGLSYEAVAFAVNFVV